MVRGYLKAEDSSYSAARYASTALGRPGPVGVASIRTGTPVLAVCNLRSRRVRSGLTVTRSDECMI